MSKDIIVEFNDRVHFMNCLRENPGVIIVQFTATWCKPCKEVKSHIEQKFSICPDNIICCQLDVDENSELYAFMKKNRQVNGIPALVAYFKGNISPFANKSISGTNINAINNFFDECLRSVR
jgi:thiol:disulfide interchange protein